MAHAHLHIPSLAEAAAIVWVSQSSRQAATQLSVFLLLKLATLSFEIPPPISASVRSRQAGTETEREASAMEALGPGKEFEAKSQARACVNAPLHLGPRLQRGLDALTRKQTEALSDFRFLWRYHAHRHKQRTRFSARTSGFSVLVGPTCGCIYPKPAQLVVSRHCVSGDLTSPSFLPRRGVFTLMFVKGAFIFRHTTKTTQSRRHLLIYQSRAKIPSRKPSKLNHRHRARRVLLGCPRPR